MATYWLETRAGGLGGGAFVAKIPFRNLQFEKGFNGPTGIRWESPLYHEQITPANLTAGLHEIAVMRNGVCVAAGPIWDATVSTDSKSINCAAQSLEDYLDIRLTPYEGSTLNYNTLIAYGLISASMSLPSANFVIPPGTLSTPAPTIQQTYAFYDGKYILEAIQDMSEAEDGFDFWIDSNTRAFNAIYPRPTTNRGLHLVYPQHISSYAVTYYGKYVRNKILVQGPDPSYVIATDTASLATYGLREYADALKDASNVNELTAYAQHIRDIRRNTKGYPTLVLRSQFLNVFDPNVIQYGDMIKVDIQDGYVNVSGLQRYKGCQVTVNKSGDETIVIYTQDEREVVI